MVFKICVVGIKLEGPVASKQANNPSLPNSLTITARMIHKIKFHASLEWWVNQRINHLKDYNKESIC